MTEKRQFTRRHTFYYSRIFDEDTHELKGRLVDITTNGMKLISDEPIETDRTFQLRMVLPVGIEGKKSISFGAKSKWCKKASNPDLYDSGFQLVSISPANVEVIEHLIQESTFSNASFDEGYAHFE